MDAITTRGLTKVFGTNRAVDRLERDEEWSASMGLTRSDVQRLRQAIAMGPGWIDRVEARLGKGLLPAFVTGLGLNEALSEPQ